MGSALRLFDEPNVSTGCQRMRSGSGIITTALWGISSFLNSYINQVISSVSAIFQEQVVLAIRGLQLSAFNDLNWK